MSPNRTPPNSWGDGPGETFRTLGSGRFGGAIFVSLTDAESSLSVFFAAFFVPRVPAGAASLTEGGLPWGGPSIVTHVLEPTAFTFGQRIFYLPSSARMAHCPFRVSPRPFDPICDRPC